MVKQGENPASCRIERKRAHDREAQRASRAKTKAYIAHLEKTVSDLSASSGDNRANYLSQHASKQAQEIESLQGLVTKIRSLVHDSSLPGIPAMPALPAAPHRNNPVEGTSPDSSGSAETINLGERSHDHCQSPDDDCWPTASHRRESTTKRIEPLTARNLTVLGESLLCEDSSDASYFISLNRALTKIEQVPDNLSPIEDDHDVIVRAILLGWDASERVHHFDIVWRFLRALDEGLWWRAGRVERLAILWQMRCFLLSRIRPKNQPKREVPSFMAPTVRQRNVQPHNVVADYFPWPLVRDHLVAEGFVHATGRNSISFAKSFRFSWPYELRDAYMKNPTTGRFRVSDSFLAAHHILSNYGMLHNRMFPPVYRHPSIVRSGNGSADEAADPLAGPNSRSNDLQSSCDGCIAEHVRADATPSAMHCLSNAVSASISAASASPPSGAMTGGCNGIAAMGISPVAFPGQDDTVSGNGADWPQAFGMDLATDGKFLQYAMDPFSMVHEATLAQWPVL